MAEGDTWLNAAVGAAVSVLLAFLPFSTVLGGAVAAFLQRGDPREGARVGALSGAIAALPFVGLLFLFAAFVPFVPVDIAALGLVVLFVVVVLGVAYAVATSALGGLLGAYLREEFGAS